MSTSSNNRTPALRGFAAAQRMREEQQAMRRIHNGKALPRSIRIAVDRSRSAWRFDNIRFSSLVRTSSSVERRIEVSLP